MKLVFVGHVDHGKSTLIGRILYDTNSVPQEKIDEVRSISESLGREFQFGFLVDHLEEERNQGITIDTTQTFFSTNKRKYTIIDAPGHVEFLKNMITGASQADAALLIVDANEGVQEQTRRHACILSMLGLRQVIIAINKMDPEYEEKKFNKVKRDIIAFLDKIGIAPSYVIPISATEGTFVVQRTRLSWFSGPTIIEALDAFTKKEAVQQRLRFPVQDIYNFDGRVIVGRVASGVLRRGDRIVILPTGEETHVEALVEYRRETDEAEAGRSTGFTTKGKHFVERGSIICDTSSKPTVTDRISAHIFWMDEGRYKKGEPILFKCATQEVIGKIEEIIQVIDSSSLEQLRICAGEIRNKEIAKVIIRTARPVVTENFNITPELGRFVLQRTDTVAGGIIT